MTGKNSGLRLFIIYRKIRCTESNKPKPSTKVFFQSIFKVMSELTEKLDRNKTGAMTRMASQVKDNGTLSSDSEENSNCNQYHDKDCSECHIIRSDPTRSELTMFLHALSYKVSIIYDIAVLS